MTHLALRGATIYPAPFEEPLRDGVVLVQDGLIHAVGPAADVRIPDAARTLECKDMSIAAGFWNSHVHFFERKWADAASMPAAELGNQLREFARYGFTSVFDLSSPWQNTRALRERIEAGEVPGPRIRSTGEGLVPPHASPPEAISAFMGLMKTSMPEVQSAPQSAFAASNLLDDGVDAIKLFISGQAGDPMPQSAIEAAVLAAHERGKPVFCHPTTAADVASALQAGVDVIAHTTPRSSWDDGLLHLINERRPALTATLTLWKFFLRHDRASVQDQVASAAIAQLRNWIAFGGTVLFGTDAGAVGLDPTGEYAMMAQAGMGFSEILASLTTAPAELFGESGRLGRIEPGFEADLVVFNGNPATDIRAMSDVRYTLRSGSITYSAHDT